jgi:hypothetical protein
MPLNRYGVKKQNAKAAHGNGVHKATVVVKADAQRKRTGLIT